MFARLLGWFGRRPTLIRGAGKLPEGQARCVALGDPLAGGTEIVLARVEGRLLAVDRLCPHEGGRLGDGPLAEGRYVVCPLHNYKFDPRNGRAVEVLCEPVKTYRVRERDGDCEVFV